MTESAPPTHLTVKSATTQPTPPYLYRDGHPTYLYFDLFGCPPPTTIERLRRLAALQAQDWYFNRTLTWILWAFETKWAQCDYKRTPNWWFNAAHKKLLSYQKIHEKQPTLSSLESRNIITCPSPAQEILLSLRYSKSLAAMKRTALQLYPAYRADSQAWWKYFSAKNEKSRRKAHEAAYQKRSTISPDVLQTIHATSPSANRSSNLFPWSLNFKV